MLCTLLKCNQNVMVKHEVLVSTLVFDFAELNWKALVQNLQVIQCYVLYLCVLLTIDEPY